MKKIIAVLIAMSFTGCATMVHGSRQKIAIGSSPSGAECHVGTETFKTPHVVELPRRSTHTVFCEIPGFHQASAMVVPQPTGWLWGNVLLGGFIGLFVDIASGAASKLVPAALQIELAKK